MENLKETIVHNNSNWSNMMKKFCLLAIAMLVIVACGPAEIGSQSDTDGNNDVECASDKDCDDGEVCDDDGMCVEEAQGDTCESDDDCDDDEFCAENGECQPVQCTSDDECDNGEVCEDNTCVEDTSDDECNEDSDCENGQVCEGNMCVEDTSPECTEDSDCEGDNMVCLEEICVEEGTDECNEDSDCDNGDSCKANTCVTDECDEDADCADGEVCETHSDKANACEAEDVDAESRKLNVEISTRDGQPIHAIVCSYEMCSNTADPASCDNGFWKQGAEFSEGSSSLSFDLELQANRSVAVKSVRMNCDLVKSYSSDCYDERAVEFAGACADEWLAHNPGDPELRADMTLTLDGESYTATNSNVTQAAFEEDASGYPVSVFPHTPSQAGAGISIPALESELGLD